MIKTTVFLSYRFYSEFYFLGNVFWISELAYSINHKLYHMKKSILNLKGIRLLEKKEQRNIYGGASNNSTTSTASADPFDTAAYICWNGFGDLYPSDSDISGYEEGSPLGSLHCVATSL